MRRNRLRQDQDPPWTLGLRPGGTVGRDRDETTLLPPARHPAPQDLLASRLDELKPKPQQLQKMQDRNPEIWAPTRWGYQNPRRDGYQNLGPEILGIKLGVSSILA